MGSFPWGQSSLELSTKLGMYAHMCSIYFAAAAVTDCHKLCGLKEQRFIIWQFWRSEVWNGSLWAEVKESARLAPFPRLRGASFSLSSPASWGACSPWLIASVHLQCQQRTVKCLSFHITMTLPLARLRGSSHYVGSTWVIRINQSPHFKVSCLVTLIPSATWISLCHFM